MKEKVAEELIRKEKAKEVTELKERLKEEQDKMATMQKTVESAKLEARKQGVLSLEIQNYEVKLCFIVKLYFFYSNRNRLFIQALIKVFSNLVLNVSYALF